ncbi:hypothetical protein C8F04DRAFT_1129320 [Mycena alexandri]|uniref:Uncharacterized protein n=1 Tax=Mycena alexandri TaxID=1745969 RepID=A0AAD6SCB4_9AGAR|nr:hypothetical protein C8F04DRAFT_1129320 [Mycena alexandri]
MSSSPPRSPPENRGLPLPPPDFTGLQQHYGDIQIGNPSLSMEDLTSIFTFPPPIVDPSANPFFDPAAYNQFFEEAQHLIQSQSSYSSSPSVAFPLTRMEGGSGSLTPSQALYSPQARYPSGSTSTSTTASAFGCGFGPAFPVATSSPRQGDNPIVTLPHNPPLTSPPRQSGDNSTLISHHNMLGPAGPPRGSLAYIRTLTPAPLRPVAVYLGFPFQQNPARRGFFETDVHVVSHTPLVSDLLRAVRGLGRISDQVLGPICVDSQSEDIRVACSQSMVEVHEMDSNLHVEPAMRAPTPRNDEPGRLWFSLANGFREVGALRDHLQNSNHVLAPASHNTTSIQTFGSHTLDIDTPLFVLYIYPANVPAPAVPQLPLQNALLPAAAGGSRSRTPAHPSTPSEAQYLLTFLPKLLRATVFLDEKLQPEAVDLAILREANYGSAYLQIREALIIEQIFRTCSNRGLIRLDIAVWAGVNANTYSNQLTYARDARATLRLLRTRTAEQLAAQSSDVMAKEGLLKGFLNACFQAALLPKTWNIRSSNSSTTKMFTVQQKVNPFKTELMPYATSRKGFKAEELTVC